MDVRCEQCQTVYELDDSRLKPGGVTVKCTQCQHTFRVGGPQGRAGATDPIALAASGAGDSGGPRQRPARSTSLGLGGAGSKQWIVRFADGSTQSCGELSTLQEWIVTGKASREAFISRNEQTWKRLGDIPELAPYFVISEELKSGAAKLPGRVHGDSRPSGRAATDSSDTLERKRPDTAVPQAVSGQATDRVFGVPDGANTSPPRAARPSRVSVPPPIPQRTPTLPPFSKVAATAAANASSGASGPVMKTSLGTQAAGRAQGMRPSQEPGFKGRARLGLATDAPQEAAFVRRDAARSEPPPDYLPGYSRGNDSRVGKWIAVVAILVIAASGFVVARMLGVGGDPSSVVTTPLMTDALTSDGGADVVADAAVADAQALATHIAQYDAILGRDAASEIEAAASQLGEPSDPTDAKALPAAVRSGLQARALVALAQQQFDLEALAEDADKKSLRDKAQATLLKAVASAQRSIKEGANPHASLAMAAIARLQKKPARDVERYLASVVEPAFAPQLAYERALLGMRDGAMVAGKSALSGLESQGASARGDVRPLMRLAVAGALAGDATNAVAGASAVLLLVPDHQVARRITQKLSPSGTPALGAAGGDASLGEESYDRVLARAERAAESDCRTAMPLYQKALGLRPASVEALTGAGFCHLAASEYASAHAKFNQALAISRKFEPALRGVAEAYAQQGRDTEAIAAYKKYLEIYPGSAAAKRQLDRLSSGSQGGTDTTQAPKSEPTLGPKSEPKPDTSADAAGPSKTSTEPTAEPTKPAGDDSGPVAMPD